jgi:hypothetical protein
MRGVFILPPSTVSHMHLLDPQSHRSSRQHRRSLSCFYAHGRTLKTKSSIAHATDRRARSSSARLRTLNCDALGLAVKLPTTIFSLGISAGTQFSSHSFSTAGSTLD